MRLAPTPINIMCRKIIPLPLIGVDQYYNGEIFTELIFYDESIQPQYYISNYGRIYSVFTKRIMSAFLDSAGYYRLTISVNGGTIFTGLHKLTLMTFHPILESNLFIPHHKDNNKQNNFIGNLEWVTVSENTVHTVNDGCIAIGEDNSRSIFTNEQVHYICSMIESGMTNTEILNTLGYEYGKERNKVAAVVRLIRRGQTYNSISFQYNIPGINGRTNYSPIFTDLVCKFLSDPSRKYRIDELCDYLEVPLNDRKMFANYVQDITRRQKDTNITSMYPVLNSLLPMPKDDPNYSYYY